MRLYIKLTFHQRFVLFIGISSAVGRYSQLCKRKHTESLTDEARVRIIVGSSMLAIHVHRSFCMRKEVIL